MTALALLAIRIAPPLASAPHEMAGVQWVVEDTRCLRGTSYGRGVPFASAWPRRSFLIEARCDPDGGKSGAEPRKDAARHVGLLLVDRQETTHQLALAIELHHALIAVGATVGEAVREHRCFHAAKRIVDKVLQAAA